MTRKEMKMDFTLVQSKFKIFFTIVLILLMISSVQVVEFNSLSGKITSDEAHEKVIHWAYPNLFGTENSPTDVLSTYGQAYMASIYNGLMRRTVASDRSFVPDLADAMPIISGDFKNWTFSIRPGLKFSDGSDLNASSIVFSYKVHLTASINTGFSILSPFFHNDSIYEINNLSVQFNMLIPYAFSPNLFSQWIYSENHFGPKYDACLADVTLVSCNFNTDLTGGNLKGGSGPFIVDLYDTTNNFIVLVPNPNYYLAGQIKIDKIIFRTIVDPAAAKVAFAAGEFNIFDAHYRAKASDFFSLTGITETFVFPPNVQEMVPNHLHRYLGLGNYITSGANARTDFSFNGNATAARNIRKAMSHLIDRTSISNEISGGLSEPASTIMPSNSIGWDETISPRIYDINLAKGYMEDAGFDYSLAGTPDPVTGFYPNPFFQITILSPTGNPDREQWATLISQELPKIGIGVKEHVTGPLSSTVFPRTFKYPGPPPNYDNGGYDIFFTDLHFELDFDPHQLYSIEFQNPNCCNVYNYNNGTTELAIAEYLNELDVAARLPLVKTVQEFLYDDLPSLPIVYEIDHYAWADNIMGLDGLSISQRELEWELIDIDTGVISTTGYTSTIDQTTVTSYTTTTKYITTNEFVTKTETSVDTETQFETDKTTTYETITEVSTINMTGPINTEDPPTLFLTDTITVLRDDLWPSNSPNLNGFWVGVVAVSTSLLTLRQVLKLSIKRESTLIKQGLNDPSIGRKVFRNAERSND